MMTRPFSMMMCLSSLTLLACGESAYRNTRFESEMAPTRSIVIKNDEGRIALRAGRPGSRVEGKMAIVASGFDTVALAEEALDDVAIVESGTAVEMVLEIAAPEVPGWPSYDVGLELVVPADVRVTVLGGDDQVDIADLLVESVETRGGRVSLYHTAGNAFVSSGAGGVEVEVHEGDLDVETRGGAINLARVYGEVDAFASNAPITADIIAPPGGDIRLITSNAPVALVLPSRFDATFLATTTSPGLIEMNGVDFYPTRSTPGALAGDLGSGSGHLGSVELRTLGADIRVDGR